MRTTTVLLLLCVSLPAGRALHAQGASRRQPLDSGAVARLTWRADGRQEVRLVAPLGPVTDSVRFCRMPASGCGAGSVNPVQVRSTRDLAGVEVPRGSHLLAGAATGALVGVLFSAYIIAALNADDTHPSTGRKLVGIGFAFGVPTVIGAMIGSGGHGWAPAP
ncbi:MAG TPA: hypothetical protein VFS40_15180 [Gemmatimonadales bacterium]|nr:hypothetical protein [Gemmatimonadales bacterium]